MNLGDHLFFEPIGRLFKENGYNVSFLPIKIMENYFLENGFDIAKPAEISQYDIVVSRPDFIREVKELKNVILIDIAYAGIKKSLINGLIDDLFDYFNLPKKTDAKPSYLNRSVGEEVYQKFGIDKNTNYVVFSNYIKSGRFRVGKKRFAALDKFVANFLQENNNLKAIHTGTQKDKAEDGNNYPFVDIDLRGKTSPMDLFDICALPNIKYYIGFDAYVMHLFFLKNKKLYLMDRGRWSQKEVFFVKNFLQPPYFIENVELIKEYIPC